MESKIDLSNKNIELEETCSASTTKTLFSYGSIIIGIAGLGVFFNPVLEILCGITGLFLSIIGKDKNAKWFTDGVRRYGNYAAWINIIWVCIEIGLKFAGVDLFDNTGGATMDFYE